MQILTYLEASVINILKALFSTFSFQQWLQLKRLTIPSVDKHVEQFELSHFAGGNVKMIELLW